MDTILCLNLNSEFVANVVAVRFAMQRRSEEDEDSFSFNVEKSFDGDELPTADAIDMPSLTMSGHPASKHSFSRRTTAQNLLNIDSDDDHELLTDPNPARFVSNSAESSAKRSAHYSDTMLQRQSSTRIPSAGPSGRQVTRVKSPRPRENHERMSSLSDSDESDELGVTKKKKGAVPGEYDSTQYEHLEVTEEIKDIFQYITKYIPQQLNLDFKFKPFIPEFIPAVGDIDAFLKVMSPEKTLSGAVYNTTEQQLGLTVLDEPAANQSDPALLHLQLRAASVSVSHSSENMVVKKVDNVEKNSKIIDKWIKDVSELHRNKAAAVVKYTNLMPEVDDLMQEWPERFENSIKVQGIPGPKFCGNLSQYVDVISSVFDIPIYKNKIQSLHALFCLYAAIKNSQLYRAANTTESRDDIEMSLNSKADHLVLD